MTLLQLRIELREGSLIVGRLKIHIYIYIYIHTYTHTIKRQNNTTKPTKLIVNNKHINQIQRKTSSWGALLRATLWRCRNTSVFMHSLVALRREWYDIREMLWLGEGKQQANVSCETPHVMTDIILVWLNQDSRKTGTARGRFTQPLRKDQECLYVVATCSEAVS